MSLVSLLVAAALAAATGETVALVGGMLHPVSGPDVAGGTLLLRDGKITALGAGLEVPAGAKVVDLKGRHVYPSLFPALTELGLVEISSVRATVDTTELGEINPQARADFAMNFDSEPLPVARSAAIPTAGVTPVGGIVSGSLAAMKLDGWTREDATLKAPAAIVVRWPDLAIDRSPAARLSVRLHEGQGGRREGGYPAPRRRSPARGPPARSRRIVAGHRRGPAGGTASRRARLGQKRKP